MKHKTKNESSNLELYTPKDIQEIFSCGKNQAYQIIHSSGFPKVQVGRRIYIPKDKLERWINSNIGKEVTI